MWILSISMEFLFVFPFWIDVDHFEILFWLAWLVCIIWFVYGSKINGREWKELPRGVLSVIKWSKHIFKRSQTVDEIELIIRQEGTHAVFYVTFDLVSAGHWRLLRQSGKISPIEAPLRLIYAQIGLL